MAGLDGANRELGANRLIHSLRMQEGRGRLRREGKRKAVPCGNSRLLRFDFWTVPIRWSVTMSHRMWGFPEIPENLKWIVMGVLAIGLAIYLVRNLSR
jgi:hypothetical protein